MQGFSPTPPHRGVFDRAASPFNRVRREVNMAGAPVLVCEYFAGMAWIRTSRRIEEMQRLRTDEREA